MIEKYPQIKFVEISISYCQDYFSLKKCIEKNSLKKLSLKRTPFYADFSVYLSKPINIYLNT